MKVLPGLTSSAEASRVLFAYRYLPVGEKMETPSVPSVSVVNESSEIQ